MTGIRAVPSPDEERRARYVRVFAAAGEKRLATYRKATSSGKRAQLDLPATMTEFWEFARSGENLDELRAVLKRLRSFYVTSADSEADLRDIRRMFNESFDVHGWGILHHVVQRDDCWDVLHELLRLGLEPDLKADGGWRPSHVASECGNFGAVKALCLCRCYWNARDDDGWTPLDMARFWMTEASTGDVMLDNKRVFKLWTAVKQNTYPNIAQLVCNQQWFAAQNLCRRRGLSEHEKFARYQGKTAVEWAEAQGWTKLAQELTYLLGPKGSPPAKAPRKHSTVVVGLGAAERLLLPAATIPQSTGEPESESQSLGAASQNAPAADDQPVVKSAAEITPEPSVPAVEPVPPAHDQRTVCTLSSISLSVAVVVIASALMLTLAVRNSTS